MKKRIWKNIFETKDEWDNLDDELDQNPFLSNKSAKERKKLEREKKIKETINSNSNQKINNSMRTTTGREINKNR